VTREAGADLGLRDDVLGGPDSAGLEPKPFGDRLSLGVAARLSRYLQVLTQARKMGKDTISSQELSDYTHINSTQIRRDLSGFGKFGKRGVGYNVDSLVSQIRKILRTSGQHNIALFGAGNLGQAIASSDIFADHGFRVVSIFDVDPRRIGKKVGSLEVRSYDTMRDVVEETLAVARANGVQMAPDMLARTYKIADAMPSQFSSTAQDLARGKPSEIDHLNGYVARRGEALGIPTPANRALHALVKLIEAKAPTPPASRPA